MGASESREAALAAGHVVPMWADQDSVAEPGHKCLATDSFKKLGLPFSTQDLFDEMLIFHRYPEIRDAPFKFLLKEVEVEDHGPNDYTVKVILDGKELDRLGKGRGKGDTTDKIRWWSRMIFASLRVGQLGQSAVGLQALSCRLLHYLDPFEGEWIDVATNDEVFAQLTMYGLGDHVEVCIDHMGERLCSEKTVAMVYRKMDEVFTRLKEVKAAKVQVGYGKASLKEPGEKSNLSAEIHGVGCGALFDAMVEVLKSTAGALMLEEDGCRFIGEAIIPKKHKNKIRTEVDYSQETGEIRVLENAMSESGGVAWPPFSRLTHVVVHKEPLRVEYWEVSETGNHISCCTSARRLHEWVNEALAIAEGK